jgi:putative transcriptional regulator
MKRTKHDWKEADALTDAEIHAAALGDTDAQPLTPERAAKMRRVPRAKSLRRALGLSQEEFATRYHIPVSTLRDWEQAASSRTLPRAPTSRSLGASRRLCVAPWNGCRENSKPRAGIAEGPYRIAAIVTFGSACISLASQSKLAR